MLDWRLIEGGRHGQEGIQTGKIINRLREAEVLLSQGATVGEPSRKLGVTEQRPAIAGEKSMAACGSSRPNVSRNWKKRTAD